MTTDLVATQKPSVVRPPNSRAYQSSTNDETHYQTTSGSSFEDKDVPSARVDPDANSGR